MSETSAHELYGEIAKAGQGITALSVGASIADSLTGVLHFLNQNAPAMTVLVGIAGFLLTAYYRRKDSLYLRSVHGERRKIPR